MGRGSTEEDSLLLSNPRRRPTMTFYMLCILFSLYVNAAQVNAASFGYDPANRKYLDTWSNAMYIPNRDQPLRAGRLESWTFYAKKTGRIVFQIWRHCGRNSFELVGQHNYTVTSAGKQQIHVANEIKVQNGDVMGFYFPKNSMIPFDGSECALKRGYYVQAPNPTSVTVGARFDFREMQHGWNPCRKYSLKANIESNAGHVATDRKYLDTWRNAIYIPNRHRVLSNGRVTSWTFYARKGGNIIFQVWRCVGSNKFKLVGETYHSVRSAGKHHIKVCFPFAVKSGDVIGFYFPANSIIPFDGSECYFKRGYYVHYPNFGQVHVGATLTFFQMRRGWNPCRKYSLTATVE